MEVEKDTKNWHESKLIFRRTAGYAFFNHRRNKEILEELKVEPTDENLRRYKSNWPRHLTSMNNNRIPKIMLNYRQNGRKRLRRHWRKLHEETETGPSGICHTVTATWRYSGR
jgi:hypothetical protein